MKVIVISGPTASGKTDLALELAQSFGGEIVNFDSLLFYREISVGTAKPNFEQLNKISHHMINIRSIKSPINASDFARESFSIIEELLKKGTPVFLVGGSGFYLQALLRGMYQSKTSPPDILARSKELYEQEGIRPFQEILKRYDPDSFERYHENDHYRIRRAAEYYWSCGQPISLARALKEKDNDSLAKPTVHSWEISHLHLDLPKDQHLKIIEKRTIHMLSKGLIKEVESLLESGFTGKEKPLQSIGYKETLDFILGRIKDIKELQERIIISTRQLAKAQRTWFKKDKFKINFHPLEEREKIFLQVETFLKSKDLG